MMDPVAHRQRLKCSVAQIDDVFAGALADAERLLTPAGIDAWLDGTSAICGLGRGQDLPVIFLEHMPRVARLAGERLIGETVELARWLSRAAVGNSIRPFLDSLPTAARRLESAELLGYYFDLIRRVAQEAPNGLVPFLTHVDHLLGQISIGGLRNWVQFGLRTYRHQPHRVADYFSLQSADARAALQRERKGTLLADHERKLNLYLRAFWQMEEEALVPYTMAYDIDRTPWPHLDKQGFHLPDVYEETAGIAGLDRYRAALAHLAAHRLWTRPIIADNYNRYQQIFIETFEDARIEHLAMARYPGLRSLWLALHPMPRPGDCPEGWSCIRHIAAMLSRALLDPAHPYTDPALLEFVGRFHERLAASPHDTRLAVELGVDYLVRVHDVSFRSPQVWFRDTEVSYRDDNRFLWIFLEDTQDEDDFHSEHNAANLRDSQDERQSFARFHPEWDDDNQSYRPDWVAVHESLQLSGDPVSIDRLLARHDRLAKKLKRVLDRLKPQNLVRERYQEDGSELDLDIALRAVVDHRAGITPDPRIHYSLKPDSRDVAVSLLIDLSESINGPAGEGGGTLLELAQEASALLAWAVNELGDPLAIAGFCSNTRHDLRHFHFKGFREPWGEEVKARLAGMQGAFSTRMGGALRHAGHYLARRPNAKKLLLVLSDGEPFDIDVPDPRHLRRDAKKAVEELASHGIACWCISLDPLADEYVQEIFGSHYLVVDRVERLPEQLARLFLSLTK